MAFSLCSAIPFFHDNFRIFETISENWLLGVGVVTKTGKCFCTLGGLSRLILKPKHRSVKPSLLTCKAVFKTLSPKHL